LKKVKTATKNWVRSARLHSARMHPDVRLGVGISRPGPSARHFVTWTPRWRVARASAPSRISARRSPLPEMAFAQAELGL